MTIILKRNYKEDSVQMIADTLASDLCGGLERTVIEYLSGYLYVTDTFAVADVSDQDFLEAAVALFRIERGND